MVTHDPCSRATWSAHVCACYRYVHVCVGVFQMHSYTLQVPMQPTGLSGRPLNPSFLLMARKRYACGKTHTHIFTNTTFTLHIILQRAFLFSEKTKICIFISTFPCDCISGALRLKTPYLTRNVKPHSAISYRNESASPSSVCPTETFLLLQLIN